MSAPCARLRGAAEVLQCLPGQRRFLSEQQTAAWASDARFCAVSLLCETPR